MILLSSQLAEQESLIHGFTMRDLGSEYARIAMEVSIPSSRIVTVNQVHGKEVIVVTSDDLAALRDNRIPKNADALITDEPGLFLGIRTADCLPVLVFDPKKRVVGAVHAGWRGMVAGVIENTLLAMQLNFGSAPSDCFASLGISLCENCFEVGPEVVEAFSERFGKKFAPQSGKAGKSFVSLRGMAAIELLNLGFPRENIQLLSGCTGCDNAKLYSYRKGDKEGRQLSFIGLLS